ncbi:MAG: pectin esterase [Lachnospiraceae bacterium]|nr:pectin esterase [Lachnospiraceae bacterium]
MKTLHLTPKDDLQYILNSLNEPTTIYLASGTYKQKIEVAASDLTIIGEGRETTVITYGDYAKKIHADGKEYNTFRTYTVCVTGEMVRLENLTVENSNTDPSAVGQCVALSVNAKSFYAKNIALKSTQDTLFLYPFPDDLVVRYRGFIPQNQLYAEGHALHVFEDCRIYGTVDFIFGCAEAYFKNCKIVSFDDGRGIGFVAAPAHLLAEENGFVFLDCEILSAGAKKSTNFLARPWRDFGKCTFINCRVDDHISPELFDKWNDTERDKTARFAYYNLNCNFTPAPVKWSKQLSGDEANKIIARFNGKIKDYNK